MEEAMAKFNSWQCPKCHKFTSKPKVGDIGKCGNCGELLFFSMKESKEPEKKEEWEEKAKKLLTPEVVVVSDKPISPPPSPSVVIHTAGTVNFSFNGLEESFVKKPHLLAWLKKFAIDNGFTLSEVIVGFVAKGVKQYGKEKGV